MKPKIESFGEPNTFTTSEPGTKRLRLIASRLSLGALFSAAALNLVQPAAAQQGTRCNSICSSVVVSPISLYGGDAAGLSIEKNGDLYVAENVNRNINPTGPFVLKVSRDGTQTVITPPGGFGDVSALALDKRGNLYIADGNGYGGGQPPPLNQVWKMTRDGNITVFVSVNDPSGLAFDEQGNLYVSSFSDGAVYKFSPEGQLLDTPLSGLGAQDRPYGVAVDETGNLYVAGAGSAFNRGSRIYKVTPYSVSVFVDAAPLITPSSLVFDDAGNLYASYYDSLKILRIAPDGSYVVFPGGGIGNDAANGLAIDRQGDLFVSVNGGRTTTFPAVVKVTGLVPTRK
jgi:streptogramin lyase